MQLGLRAKLTMVMTGLVLLAVAVMSGVFLELLLQQVLHDTDKRANELSSEVFESARHALEDAKAQGLRPASDDEQGIHEYVSKAFEMSDGLASRLQSDSSSIYEVSIVDHDGVVLVSSDPRLKGKVGPRRAPLQQLVQSSFVRQVKILSQRAGVYDVTYPFVLRGQPFGEVRVAVSTALLLHDIGPRVRMWGTVVALALILSSILAAVVSGAALSPIRDILAQLEKISVGEYDAPSGGTRELTDSSDELGQVRRKITQVGQQLRGVHEIFSSMRENMNSVMAGLEDGLILFTRDNRAVMISPAAEKFLGTPASQYLGRKATEMFPPEHPLYDALHLAEGGLHEVAAETEMVTVEGKKRLGVSVQVIQGAGERMGAMVTLRDLDSLESISTQLQLSLIHI